MTVNHLLAALVATGLLAWQFWPWLSALAGGWKWPTIAPPPARPADSDVADLAALKQVEDRFRRLGCNEGLAACQVMYAHFFHEGGHS